MLAPQIKSFCIISVKCLYYKCSLPPRVIDISYLQKCVNFEVKLTTKHETFSVSINLLDKQKMNWRQRTQHGTHCKQKLIRNCSTR